MLRTPSIGTASKKGVRKPMKQKHRLAAGLFCLVLAAGLALLVAAAVSMGAGAWGASHSTDWYTVQKSFVIR